MAGNISNRLEDLNLSRDEVERLGNALKQEEFRKLLFDYAREINDPANKKEYEDGITQLENERGVDIKFVHPEPQYVLKTCFNPGGEKVFVNICSNVLVGKPESNPCLDSEGSSGTNWRLPLIQAPPREDLDKSGTLCTVYDVLFHPETHALSDNDRRFRNFVEETALNAVEEAYSVKLDRNSVKRPRMKFKGLPRPTVIRTRRPETGTDMKDIDDDNLISQFPYPYDMPPEKLKPMRQLKPMKMEPKTENDKKESFITPKYIVKQSSDVDMANYEQNLLSHHDITVPQRLVLVVELPYVKSSSELELDLEAQKVSLCSNGKRRYKLELKLPYPVEENKGTAKFDKDVGKLLVTMVVDRKKAVLKKPNSVEGDSGIESDLGGGRASSGEEEDARISECQPTTAAEGDGAKRATEGEDKIVHEDGRTQFHKCLSADAENIHQGISGDEVMEETLEVELSKMNLREEPRSNGEIMGWPENISQISELEEKASEKMKLIEEVECATAFEAVDKANSEEPVESKKERNDTAKDVIRPGIPYLMPSFSCSCIRERGTTLVTFILNVKNVDPSSINKGMKCLEGLPKEQETEKPSRLAGASDANGASLPSENGSVRNEYRTVGEVASPKPTAISSVDVTSDICSTIAEVNRPNNECKPSSLLPGNSVPESAALYSADSPVVNHVAGECSSDNLKKLLVINDEKTEENASREDERVKMENQKMICFFVTFSSVGAGYFPQNYSFCVNFPSTHWPNIDPECSDCCPITVEVWDNNVEIQWRKPSVKNDKLVEFGCFVGQDFDHLEAYKLPSFEEKDLESESFSEPEVSSSNSISEDKKEMAAEKQSDSYGAKNENEKVAELPLTSAQRRKMFKERTLSESSVESNSTKHVKGILKRRGRAGLGRSLSESSGGEEYSWVSPLSQVSLSSSVTSSPSLSDVNRLVLGECLKEEEEEYDEEEDDDEEDGEKVKKIVRFSDVISQKTFRSNSSILGQRKKNQRKMRNKKRAAERRASESENSVDEGEMGTDKSDCNSDSSSEKAEIPLHPDQAGSKGKPKGSSKRKGNGSKGKGKKLESNSKSNNPGGTTISQHYEFKSDLIFQLEL